ncbi:hypothetical protein OH77DRAFT_1416552 [Trametes cingulata]|nr:hypothetical protein OH77DRAFT_1416552 [Trametes cingulata]
MENVLHIPPTYIVPYVLHRCWELTSEPVVQDKYGHPLLLPIQFKRGVDAGRKVNGRKHPCITDLSCHHLHRMQYA